MQSSKKIENVPLSNSEFSIAWTQDRKVSKVEWRVMGLDMMLGIIGGLTVIVWGALKFIFSGYETFKLENSLIGAVYPTAPLGRPDADFEDYEEDWTPKDT